MLAIKKCYQAIIIMGLMVWATASYAEMDVDWVSFTLDNDLFLNNDNGYTNGVFFSIYDTGVGEDKPKPSLLVWPMMWSLPDVSYHTAVNAYSVGQVMMTPDDITLKNPPEDQLPYSGVLFLNTSYLAIQDQYADKISTTLGVVGPVSGAKRSQKFVHRLIGSKDPKGWGTQLKNEPIFQLTRARAWRALATKSNWADMVVTSEIAAGTLSSYVETGMTVRVGQGLQRSYASVLLNGSRTTNPVAIDDGWYLYAGVKAGYVFNQIFTDGNTFRDSRSVDYDHERIGVTAGLAYSWGPFSMTLALADSNILDSRDRAEQLEDLTQYGSLTIAWKL